LGSTCAKAARRTLAKLTPESRKTIKGMQNYFSIVNIERIWKQRERFTNLDKLNLNKFARGSSQFLIIHMLPQKIMLPSKVVNSDSKIIISYF